MISFESIKDRKLFQWSAAYLAGAWVLLQVIGLLSDTYGWPSVVMRLVPVLLALGFLATLILAWYHGEKGQQHVSGAELLLLSALLVGAGGVVWYAGKGSAEAAIPTMNTPSGPSSESTERSVAVLPFDNLSRDPDNEYFSDGITDEILTTLANVGDLRVISRTSVMQYKGSKKPLRQIATELGVAHVLEGSVQRAGNQVRINAQLIDAKTDAHLWAQRYDRPLQDIFAVQSEIAQQIAQALQARLSPAEQQRVERAPTANLTAHDYVLRGKEFLWRGSPRDAVAALSLLRKARALDPKYPDAHAALAKALRFQWWYTGDRRWLDSAVVTAQRSVALDPAFAEGHSQFGWALDWRGDLKEALVAHRRAVQLNPNLSDGLANLYFFGFGRLDESARWWAPAIQTDPTNGYFRFIAGRAYLSLGMHTRARAVLEKAIEFWPEYPFAHYSVASMFLLEGRTTEARDRIQQMLAASGNDPDGLILAGHAEAALGDFPAARRYLEQGLPGASDWFKAQGELLLAYIIGRSGETDHTRALVHDAARRFEKRSGDHPNKPDEYIEWARARLMQGDREAGLRLLEEGVQKGWRYVGDYPNDPILNSLRGEPRYERLMAQVKADIDRQRARVERERW